MNIIIKTKHTHAVINGVVVMIPQAIEYDRK